MRTPRPGRHGFAAARAWRIALALPVMGSGTILAGCTPARPSPAPAEVVDIDPDETWASIRAAQSDRLDALSVFSSAGDATIRFTDEDGDRRTEQVDLRLWRVAPTKAAVRLSKVGNAFLLAGWNGDRWWLLDESGDRPVLQIRGFDATTTGGGAAALLSPPTLLATLGLLPWPESPPPSLRAFDLDADGEPDGFSFEVERLAWRADDGDEVVLPGRMTVTLARPSDGPTRIELRDEGDRLVLTSQLERFEPVETRGRPPGAWPSVSHRMRATRPDGDEIVVRLDGPLAGADVSSRLFDLEAIRKRAPDAVVQDETAGRGGSN